jgi:putative transposase
MDGHHRLRHGRRSESGRIYLVTTTTRDRQPFFSDWTIGAATARALSCAEAWPNSRLLCWVLMPDHWHGIIELGDEALELAVGRAKAVASREVGRVLGRPLPLWAPCYHDHALRRDDTLVRVARYVVANPLRAGLVQEVGGYPFWNAVWLGAAPATSEAGFGNDAGVAVVAGRVGAGRR